MNDPHNHEACSTSSSSPCRWTKRASRTSSSPKTFRANFGFIDGVASTPDTIPATTKTSRGRIAEYPARQPLPHEQVAYLVDRLDSIDEGNDTTLLDNTLVFFGSCMMDGNTHTRDELPIVLLGGGASGLQHGYYDFVDVGPNLGRLRFHRTEYGPRCRTSRRATPLTSSRSRSRRRWPEPPVIEWIAVPRRYLGAAARHRGCPKSPDAHGRYDTLCAGTDHPFTERLGILRRRRVALRQRVRDVHAHRA